MRRIQISLWVRILWGADTAACSATESHGRLVASTAGYGRRRSRPTSLPLRRKPPKFVGQSTVHVFAPLVRRAPRCRMQNSAVGREVGDGANPKPNTSKYRPIVKELPDGGLTITFEVK